MMDWIKCFFGFHLVAEWDHSMKLDRRLFRKGTVILKKPYCVRCLKICPKKKKKS